MWLFLIADSVYLEGATMSVIEKCSMYERMLSMCERGAASGDLGAKMGIAKYRSKLAALNAVRAMIAGVEPKSNSAASYESRIANIVAGGESYFYGDAAEITEATALMGAIFRRLIRVDGPSQNGYVRLAANDIILKSGTP